ncbi:hypothetical protein Pst134EA_015964 [Puccinia striiformis f. sp. tritici]|uniref:Uncharacterized protein n=2 Tax=Puccinia striiformis TaxID=27350 RepID=A0A2S4V495_9BASI|nr:hypothetical protein Pst134EA_015964 [Puccinia striiformis f. sp. tritici]KAH9463883.1 hypothetical protein Pst134EA_015964 [Puccinia striiformis f. sp. tritici]POW04321.1 hypothetical protein PSHT_11226 [Puccinia striiformis]POW06586.1 hypothetical protein PSTT_08864 [Puccinia striiformis]
MKRNEILVGFLGLLLCPSPSNLLGFGVAIPLNHRHRKRGLSPQQHQVANDLSSSPQEMLKAVEEFLFSEHDGLPHNSPLEKYLLKADSRTQEFVEAMEQLLGPFHDGTNKPTPLKSSDELVAPRTTTEPKKSKPSQSFHDPDLESDADSAERPSPKKRKMISESTVEAMEQLLGPFHDGTNKPTPLKSSDELVAPRTTTEPKRSEPSQSFQDPELESDADSAERPGSKKRKMISESTGHQEDRSLFSPAIGSREHQSIWEQSNGAEKRLDRLTSPVKAEESVGTSMEPAHVIRPLHLA